MHGRLSDEEVEPDARLEQLEQLEVMVGRSQMLWKGICVLVGCGGRA
jgi:hypothetical protein